MSPRSTTVATVNRCQGRNWGDRLIAETLQLMLASRGHTVKTLDLLLSSAAPPSLDKANAGGWNDSIGPRFHLQRRLRHRASAVVRELRRQADGYILGGGELLQGNRLFPSALVSWAILTRLRRVPYAVFGVGATERSTGLQRHLLSYAVRHARHVVVRDHASLEEVQALGARRASLTHDVVFALPTYLEAPNPQGTRVVACPASYSTIERYLGIPRDEYLFSFVDLLTGELTADCHVAVVASDLADITACRDLLNLLHQRGISASHVEITCTSHYVEVMASAAVVVSARMHPMIVALAYGGRVKAFERNAKLSQFSQQYGDGPLDSRFLGSIQASIESSLDQVAMELGIGPDQ